MRFRFARASTVRSLAESLVLAAFLRGDADLPADQCTRLAAE